MKMTTEQYVVWVNAKSDVGEHYDNIVYFIDCLESANINLHYSLIHGNSWFDDVFPEYPQDTIRFKRVWLGDEPIEVED